MSTTDQALLDAIQYAVIEPPDLGATWPSGLWTRPEIISYLNLRQSRFLKATRLWIGIAEVDVVGWTSRFALPADWIATLAVAWRTPAGVITFLDRMDQFEADHGQEAWESTAVATPLYYMDYATPTLQLQLAPLPLTGGTAVVYYVPQGAPLGDVVDAELLTVNDAFVAAAAKYGTLADMLAKDGRGKNAEKAAYCEARYQLGIDCARIILGGWV